MIQDNRRAGTRALSSQNCSGFAVVTVLVGLLSGCSRLGSTSSGSSLQLSFIRPVDGQLLSLRDETDPLTAGFQADIQLQVQDTTGRTLQALSAQLQIKLSSDQTWSLGPAAQISGTSITFQKATLPGGIVTLQATVSEAATQRSTTQTITINVPVVNAPTVQFTSPIARTYSTRMIAVSALVSGEAAEGQPVDIYDQVGIGAATKIGSLTVRNAQISGALVFVNGTHIVIGNIVDAIGNPGAGSVSNVLVASVGCSVAITRPPSSPVYFNRNDDEDPVTPGLQYTIRGVSTDCLGVSVQLLKGTTNPTLIGTTTTDPTTGAFAFPITLLDGEQTRLTARMTDPNSGQLTSAFVDVTGVKLTPPVISNIIPSQSNLFCVADSNYHLFLSPPTPGYIQDKIPDGDCEADFSFTVANAAGGVASLVYRGATLQRQITADPQTVSFINAVFTQNTSGQVQFQAIDIAGNTAVSTANMTVDVIPPAPSSFTIRAIPDGGARVATVNLAWTASGAHGDAGTPVGYDLRWSTNAVLPGTLVDGGYVDGGIRDDPTYFDLTKVVQVSGGPLPPTTLSYQLTPLPPLASYSIQVRALNPIGNYARISPQTNLDNFLSTVALVNPTAAATGFGAHLAKGDFNVDGADDLVVGASLIQPGAVWVYYGGPSFGTAPQQLVPYDGQAGNFGLDFGVGDVGNPDGGTPAPDLLIGQNTWSSGRGRAFLYFGRPDAGIDPTTFVEFRGTALPPPAGGFGGSSRIIADINGDGLGEVLISAQRESSNVGKVFLFYGRSQEQWMAARTGLEVDGNPFIPTSSADRVFTGDGPPDSFFGRLRGYADLGDLTGDGGVAFTIPASLDNVNKVFIYSGPVVQSRGDGGTVAVTDATQTLQRAAVTDAGTLFGFGYEAVGKANFIAGPANDLVVSLPRNNQVLIFPDGTPTGFNTPPEIISSINGNFGASLSYGDINLDGRPDIVVGENASGFNQQAWIFYNRGTPGTEFDPNAGAGFFQSRLVGPRALGIGVVVGDFNGDGRPDVAAGDNLDGNGKVTVWY